MHSKKSHSKYRTPKQENDGNTCKKLEHLCALRGRSKLVNIFQWTGSSRREKRLQRYQPAFFKNWQQARVLWANFWQDCPCPGSETASFSTRVTILHTILYEILLESHYQNLLLALSCSIALLTRQITSRIIKNSPTKFAFSPISCFFAKWISFSPSGVSYSPVSTYASLLQSSWISAIRSHLFITAVLVSQI